MHWIIAGAKVYNAECGLVVQVHVGRVKGGEGKGRRIGAYTDAVELQVLSTTN